MAIGAGQEGAVHSQVRRALEAGATRDEFCQVGLLALTTLGIPTMIMGMTGSTISSRAVSGSEEQGWLKATAIERGCQQ